MSLIKFNNRNRLFPWSNTDLKSFLGSDDFFNDDFFSEDSLMPAMNVKENPTDFQIEFAAPGFSKEDFEVSIDNDILHVSGEKSKEKEQEDDNYSRKEFSYNTFKRSLKLPASVNTEKEAQATYKDGILKLQLSKKEAEKPSNRKRIEVK
ncbi:MAG TPA: heat-shock protein [Xanthomarina gelatinilytica]|jgi:HSP20 family protein|uniref:Heat-shock protein n=2 Tax=Xanthomarina gelatinilytica TaxID=1137281 RepID=A0A3D6BUP3_9FLAO|nr:Hsp20/alpha crystallin family protein [Xanthomarina gelatinilytica]HCY82953.1 heat-shock protein [Xanthomarina gelatinilytica]|tara:strand:+ start:893 stop:1342 length:450 start_codon:yes stop_codon:yes gene_type:complete